MINSFDQLTMPQNEILEYQSDFIPCPILVNHVSARSHFVREHRLKQANNDRLSELSHTHGIQPGNLIFLIIP